MKQGTANHTSKPKQGFVGKEASLRAVSEMGARQVKPPPPLMKSGKSSPAKMARDTQKRGTQGKH